MGCGASAAPPRVLDQNEMREMCDVGAREMEILCVTQAMGKPETLIVKPPDCVNKHRANAQKLRDAAEYALTAITEITSGDMGERVAGAVAKGGMLGKVFGMAGQAVDKAAEMSGAAAGAAVSSSLNLMSQGLDKAIDAIQKPFTDVGKDLVNTKYNDILKVYADFINNYKFADSLALCRGAEPFGPDEYNACAGDAISSSLTAASVQDLAKLMLPIVQTEIDKHAITKAWDLVIDSTNAAYDFIRQYAVLENFGLEKTDLDINIYIVTETILGLGELMGKEEAAIRVNPQGKSRRPETFAVVFSGVLMNEVHLKNMKENGK